MGHRANVLSAGAAALLAVGGCVSTDVTSGLPCNRDRQCGGREECESGYCGGPPEETAVPTTATDIGMESSEATAEPDCYAPEFGCPSCDPLEQPCSDRAACYPTSNRTAECVELHGEAGVGEPCGYPFDSACAPGLTCAPTIGTGCPGDRLLCCFEICDLRMVGCPTGTCEPLWGASETDLDHLGYCTTE